jgi:hypothetical protein
VIRSRNTRLNAAELQQRVEDELAREPGSEGDERLVRLAATVHAHAIEAQLERAESRARPRTAWPDDVRIPLVSWSASLRRLVLNALSLAFRDQFEVNAALIRSQRESLALIQSLLDRIEVLETRLEAERAAARTQRIAQRRSEEP